MKISNSLKLTQAQRNVLASATERSDGACRPPIAMKKNTAQKLATSLIANGFARQVRARADMPAWQSDNANRPQALFITKRGRNAIAVIADITTPEHDPVKTTVSSDGGSVSSCQSPRAGSKLAHVVMLVGRQTGASLPELISATGWLPHTTRAALTGLRKRGYAVAMERQAHGGKVYRLAVSAAKPVTA